MLKEDELIGAIAIYRQEVRPFTDKQIELVQNFAAQAVIAIENTRLLNELRESLQQQTATSDVLKVISSSPGELEPCSRRCWRTRLRICEAKFGTSSSRYEDGVSLQSRCTACRPTYAEFRSRSPQPATISPAPSGASSETKQIVHIHDVTTEPAYVEANPCSSPPSSLAASEPCSSCRCSRRTS